MAEKTMAEYIAEGPTVDVDASSEDKAKIRIADIMLPDGATPITQRTMHLRHLTVLPGGVIALHSHFNRPAILHVMQGEMREYSSTQPAPRHLKAGDTITEFNDLTQFAVNPSETETLIIQTFDLLDEGGAVEGC
jgi:quercetin dioxygenase-like cupin family protein